MAVRFRATDYAFVESAAADAGYSLGRWISEVGLTATGTEKDAQCPPMWPQRDLVLSELQYQFLRLGLLLDTLMIHVGDAPAVLAARGQVATAGRRIREARAANRGQARQQIRAAIFKAPCVPIPHRSSEGGLQRVTIRFFDDELELVQASADGAAVTVAQWLEWIALEVAFIDRLGIDPVHDRTKDLVASTRRLGQRINETTAYTCSRQQPPPRIWEEMRMISNQAGAVIKTLEEALHEVSAIKVTRVEHEVDIRGLAQQSAPES